MLLADGEHSGFIQWIKIAHASRAEKHAPGRANLSCARLKKKSISDWSWIYSKGCPQELTIHRLTGDAPKEELISPLWSLDKKSVLNGFNKNSKPEHLTRE